MRLNPSAIPITESNEAIRAAIAEIETPPLLAAVACLTGDLSILRADLAPSASESFDPTAGISPEMAANAREIAC